jgi:hypothetical protein
MRREWALAIAETDNSLSIEERNAVRQERFRFHLEGGGLRSPTSGLKSPTSLPQTEEGRQPDQSPDNPPLLSKKGYWRPPMPFAEAWQLAIEEVDQDLPPWEKNSLRLERYYHHLGGPWEFPDRGN